MLKCIDVWYMLILETSFQYLFITENSLKICQLLIELQQGLECPVSVTLVKKTDKRSSHVSNIYSVHI